MKRRTGRELVRDFAVLLIALVVWSIFSAAQSSTFQ